MDHTGPLLDLSHAGPDIISMVLGSLPLRERFTCALVCKAWAKEATAATHTIIKHRLQDLSGLQHWLEKHGNGLEVLQLHACRNAALTALPCCAKLQDLLLQGFSYDPFTITSRTWANIASATKLTSIGLKYVQTASQQADVVAALAALPNLEQLTWCYVYCSNEQRLSDSSLLQRMTGLTSLELQCLTAAPLQHLGSLTKLQHLSIGDAEDWAAAGCPGLQELKALTSLKLDSSDLVDLPCIASQLPALGQLNVRRATTTAVNQLHVLAGLTQLCVGELTGLSPESPPLKLSALQHLELSGDEWVTMPMAYLASCTQLQFLDVQGFQLKGPGSLVASTMLQHLELDGCSIMAADGAADPVSWQQVFPGPGQLLHLTSLQLLPEEPAVQKADINSIVECCRNLKVLGLDTCGQKDSFAPALAQLPGLTNLHLDMASDEQCRALVQLTGLRQLEVGLPWALMLSAEGLRQLAALQQLTSLGFGTFYNDQLNALAQHLMKDNLAGCHHAIINKVKGQRQSDGHHALDDNCRRIKCCLTILIHQRAFVTQAWDLFTVVHV